MIYTLLFLLKMALKRNICRLGPAIKTGIWFHLYKILWKMLHFFKDTCTTKLNPGQRLSTKGGVVIHSKKAIILGKRILSGLFVISFHSKQKYPTESILFMHIRHIYIYIQSILGWIVIPVSISVLINFT